MPFNLDDLNPATRFFYRDSNGVETGEWIELRICSGENLNSIYEQTRKKVAEYKRGIRYAYEDINTELEADLMHDYAIVDWRLLDDKDNEIPCNKENKSILMRGSVDFASFVTSCLQKLNDKYESFEEEREKNS